MTGLNLIFYGNVAIFGAAGGAAGGASTFYILGF